MMATTHALAGMTLATVALFVAPEHASAAVIAGAAGGVFPDLDLYSEHRKTLHFPVYYAGAALVAAGAALAWPGTTTVIAVVFLLSAALHSMMDAFGGGLELRPWLGVSDRAVYDHARGRWIAPRRWVRYDGAPEDLALAAALALPPLFVFEGIVPSLVAGALAVSAVYVLLRKRLVDAAERVVAATPPLVLRYVPDRFVEDVAP